MDIKTYTEQALTTESQVTELGVNPLLVHTGLLINAMSAEILNQIKRAAFYKKDFDQQKFNGTVLALAQGIQYIGAVLNAATDVVEGELKINTERFVTSRDTWLEPIMKNEGVPQEIIDHVQKLSTDGINLRVLHAIIGIASEAGELSHLAVKTMQGKEFDKVNFGEELGDIEWYQAIAFDAAGVDEAAIRTANVAKLAKRREAANQEPEKRDLEGERAVLEAGLAEPAVAQ